MNSETTSQPNPELTSAQEVAGEVFFDSIEELDQLKAELASLMEKVDKIKSRISQTEHLTEKLSADYDGVPEQAIKENIGKLTADMATTPPAHAVENPAATQLFHDSQGGVHTTREDALAADGRSA